MPVAVHPVFRVSVVAIIVFQVAALFARSMLDLSLRDRGMDPAVANDLSYLAVPSILLILMFPYLCRCRDSLRRLFAPHRLTPRVVGLSIALGLILRLIWWSAVTVLIRTGRVANDDPNALIGPVTGFDCPPLPVLLLSLLVMAVTAPLVEEIVHRGFVLHGLLPQGLIVAVVASAASFALMHEPDSYLAAFLVGSLLAVQALNYRALWGPVIAHATYNACAVFDWDCLQIIWNPSPTDANLVTLTWAAVPVIVAGATASLLIVGKRAAGTQ